VRIGKQVFILLSILLLGLALRLYHVTSPYLDHHSWRQTDTAAIARNFYRHGFNILRPEVDWAGPGPSAAELELQITPLLTSGLYVVWGVKDWVGRIVPILFSLVAIVYFYRLVRLYENAGVAAFAAFALAILPLNVFFTRVPMPESGATLFSIAALYHLSMYRHTETRSQYWLGVVFTALAFLSKLTTLYLIAPLLFILLRQIGSERPAGRRIALFFALALAPAFAYYGYMHASADVKLIPYSVGTDKWGSLGTWINPGFYMILFGRLRSVVYTWLGLLLVLVGLFRPVRSKLFHVWLLAAVGYVFVVARGNLVHSYYQMPLVPAGAFFIGLVLHELYVGGLTRPLSLAGGVALFYVSVTNLLPMYGLYAHPAFEAAAALKNIDRSGSLVLYVPHRPDINPEMLYYADRRGWIISPREISVATIEAFRRKGAAYLVMPQPRYVSDDLKGYLRGRTVWTGQGYTILKL
jgi:hypothetical protein